MKRIAVVASLVLVSCIGMRATERHWPALVSDLIVIGTLQPGSSVPGLTVLVPSANGPERFWGWRMRGTIAIDEVLFGSPPSGRIEVEFGCPFSFCRWWWPPQFPPSYSTSESGIWFLRHVEGRWTGPDGYFQVARANITHRADWEDYIRRYKH